MAVRSAMMSFFPAERVCVPFVGFQDSTERTTSADLTFSTTSATILVDVFGYNAATIYFAISVAAVGCDLLGSTNISLVVQGCYLSCKCGLQFGLGLMNLFSGLYGQQWHEVTSSV